MSNMLRVSGAHESDRRTLMPGLARLVEMRRGRCVWLLASLVVLGAASWTHASGLIPGTYPISVSTELEIKETVTVNGQTVNEGKTGADSVMKIDGTRDTVRQTLPSLEPPTFPANASNTDVTEGDSPFISSTEVFFKKITITQNHSATFSGGGPFHIDELKLEEDATVHLAAGVYFIDAFKMDDKRTSLMVSSEPVILHIGKEWKLDDEDITVNAGGSVTGLRVFLHDEVEVKGEKGLNFTGLLYGPQAKEVEMKEEVTFHGAIIINGEIKLEKHITLTYTAADQAAVSAIDPAETGGGANAPPVAHAGFNRSVEVGETVELDGSGSTDADGNPLTLAWSFLSHPPGSTATLTTPTSVLPTFTIDQPGDYVVQLLVNDGVVDSAPDTVTLSTGNVAPHANAGPDQTGVVTQSVLLDGTQSTDPNSDGLTYQWTLVTKPAGSAAVLNDPTSPTPSFTVDQAGTYHIELVVSDGLLFSEPDTVIIDTTNSTPVAHAGPDHTVRAGTQMTLDGTGSTDVDGDPLTYRWTQTVVPPGNTAALSDPVAAAPTLTPDVDGEYVVQLQVDDGTVTSEPDTALILVGNTAPTADAGPDHTVSVGATVQLDGTGSTDLQHDPLTYLWTLGTVPSGSAATLSDATSSQPTLVADLPGSYTATLIVNDGDLDSDPDTVTIITQNSPPVAEAGPDQTVAVGATVQLDGSGSSDPESQPLSYQWSLLIQPAGSAATLANLTSVTPTFVVDVAGTYVVQLIVDDGLTSSPPDTVTITAGNAPPVLNPIGNRTVMLGHTLNLTLTGSDPNGDPVHFGSTTVPLPTNMTLHAATGQVVFHPDASQVGSHVLTFFVSDGIGRDEETLTITAQGPALMLLN